MGAAPSRRENGVPKDVAAGKPISPFYRSIHDMVVRYGRGARVLPRIKENPLDIYTRKLPRIEDPYRRCARFLPRIKDR